ncbi:HAD family hydrolase [Myceligenerans pegani]|uniref:HAD family phosphatase n=1 Tax=Myceligenerans pegani TaxID=2776917 RepID=A0ABR9MUH5_9MICO|nr:HAD family hydrolase [Myceligenerans sp. TRM 65318]MBE1875039.1 HAD family phosphatase [Myceligenerans sp. TRM 65318]MBE3017310.1 HAD family phosphatase [Myceligenerans sp. TRM 65318]
MINTHPAFQATTPGRPVKVVFLDYDGTIVRNGNDDVPEPVRRAVARAIAKGIKVVPCTGRSALGILPVAELLGLGKGAMFIASNGAITGELTGDRRRPFEVIRQRGFDPWAAFTVSMAVEPQVAMAVEQVGVGWRVNKPFPANRLRGLQHLVDERVLWSEHTTRAVVHAPGIAAYAAQIEGTGCTVNRAADDWLDITKRGLSKASEADALRQRWGIHPDDTAAIGDARNDIPLLHQVQHAFAMGDADQVVKDAADYIVGSIDYHGAAAALNSLTLSTRESSQVRVDTGVGAR